MSERNVMKKINSVYCSLISGLLITSSLYMNIASAAEGTESLKLDVITTVTAGTCKVKLMVDKVENNTVAFGDVYTSEVVNESKSKSFSLIFSECESVNSGQAKITLRPKSGVSCDAAGAGNAFANTVTGAGSASAVAVAIRTKSDPKDASGEPLNCGSPVQKTVRISPTADTEWPLNARLVVAAPNSSDAVTAGSFSSQGTFNIVYE